MADDILRPSHYVGTEIEPRDVIEDWDLPHYLACVVKYLKRYRLKGDPRSDLRKAKRYIEMHLEFMDKKERRRGEG